MVHILIVLATLTFSMVNASDTSSAATVAATACDTASSDLQQLYYSLAAQRNQACKLVEERRTIFYQTTTEQRILGATIRRIEEEHATLAALKVKKANLDQKLQDERVLDAQAIRGALEIMQQRNELKTKHSEVCSRKRTAFNFVANWFGEEIATATIGDSDDPVTLSKFAEERLGIGLSRDFKLAINQLDDYIKRQGQSEA